MINEIWKDMPEWCGYYQVSNLGKVRSLTRKTASRPANGKALKEFYSTNGYLMVCFSKESKLKRFLIHRLVAICFLENKNNYPVVNHKNGNKLDNRADNLEWCTTSQNAMHAYKTGLRVIKESEIKRLIEWNKTDHGVKISQYTKGGEHLGDFISIAEAARQARVNYNALFSCVRGRSKTCGGFVFKLTHTF